MYLFIYTMNIYLLIILFRRLQKAKSSSVIFIIIIVSLKNKDNIQYGNFTGKLYKYIEMCCWLYDRRLNLDVVSTVHEGDMKTYSS